MMLFWFSFLAFWRSGLSLWFSLLFPISLVWKRIIHGALFFHSDSRDPSNVFSRSHLLEEMARLVRS
ncbi:hypothetical protein BJX76DRAFT_336443 [Aspergillus varians]